MCMELPFQSMTEESGGTSAEEITCHQLPWRSKVSLSSSRRMQVHVLHQKALLFNYFPCRGNKVHAEGGCPVQEGLLEVQQLNSQNRSS